MFNTLIKNRICILIPMEVIERYFIDFNPKEASILSSLFDWECNCFKLYLIHREFEEVPEGECCKTYYLNEAQKKFPYLFYDTNPLLYRKFN